MSSVHDASTDSTAVSSSSPPVSMRRSSTKTETSKVLNVHLLIAFLPTILSILYFRWNSLADVIGGPASTTSSATTIRNQTQPFQSTPLVVSNHHSSLDTATRGELYDLYARSCPRHDYRIRIFSYDPYIVYVEDFLPQWERRYLLNLAEDHYSHSQVSNEVFAGQLVEGRTSQSAFLPFDPVRDCIMQRAADFQGGVSFEHVESLQMVKYNIGNQYKVHYDYGVDDLAKRISTFFAYIECTATSDSPAPQSNDRISEQEGNTSESTPNFNGFSTSRCEGGETWFPSVSSKGYTSSWCDVVDCEDKEERGGVAFKAKPGNAVFWSNLYANGTYHEGVGHAGLPVKSGQKVGLNIWTRDMAAPQTKFRNDEEIETEEEFKKQEVQFKKYRAELKKAELKRVKDRLRRLKKAEDKLVDSDQVASSIEPA